MILAENKRNNRYSCYYTNQSKRSYNNDALRSYENTPLFARMFNIGRDLCFILACVLTVLALLSNNQFKPFKTTKPKPFFSESLWVTDVYTGDLDIVMMNYLNYDVSVTLLYSPWDAQSQDIRTEFEDTCRYFYKKIYCIAVNCWHVEGSCRAQFKKIPYFPIMMVDFHHAPTVNYDGALDSSHMIHFISSAIYPLQRVNSMEQFHYLRNIKDILIITFIPMTNERSIYNAYYTTSLGYLEIDPRRNFCWSVVTDKYLADKLELKVGIIKMLLWNESILREIATDYYNCGNATWLQTRSQYLARKRRDLLKTMKSLTLHCATRPISVVVCSTLINRYAATYFPIGRDGNFGKVMSDDQFHNCSYTKGGNELFNKCPQRSTSPTYQSYSNCMKTCRKIYTMNKHFQYSFDLYIKRENSSKFKYTSDFEGLGCKLKYQMSFIAVDSLLNSEYAHALGINLKKYTDQTVFGIIDHKEENVHVLPADIADKATVSQFIMDYSKLKLPRWYKSSEDSSIYINRYTRNVSFDSHNSINVLEVNSSSFYSIVFNTSHHVVVYHYSLLCSYCQVVARRFLKVAHMLKHFIWIKFVRIDGENNDLPWHLTATTYPSVFIFPAKRKGESRLFSSSKKLTVKNILEFILRNVDSDTSSRIMVHLCLQRIISKNTAEDGVYSDIEKCILNVKHRCLLYIYSISEQYTKLVTQATSKKINLTAHFKTMLMNIRHLKNLYSYLENISIPDLKYEHVADILSRMFNLSITVPVTNVL